MLGGMWRIWVLSAHLVRQASEMVCGSRGLMVGSGREGLVLMGRGFGSFLLGESGGYRAFQTAL